MPDSVFDSCDDYEDNNRDNYHSDNIKALSQKYENAVDLRMINRNQNRDKGDRATTDHALDRRSATIIYKMISQGVFKEISGCISTGK